jgi:putative transposase
VLRAERSSYHYRGKGADQADLKKRIKEIAETRVRYGYRRIHVLLRRDGWKINGKRVYRLYKEMGLQLRKKAPKRRVKGKRRRNPALSGIGWLRNSRGDRRPCEWKSSSQTSLV